MSSALTTTKPMSIAVPIRCVLFGVIVCVFSLNGVLRWVANHWPGGRLSNALAAISLFPESLYKGLPGGQYLVFELLFRWALVLLATYLLLLLIASIRHGSPAILVSSVCGLLIGLFALTWISILILVVSFLFAVVMWIKDLVTYVITAIVSFFLWPPVFYTLLTLIVIAIVAGVIVATGFSIKRVWEAFKAWVRNMSAKPLILLLVILASLALIWFVAIPLWQLYISPILLLIRNFLAEYVGPIITWIVSWLITLASGVIVIALVLGALGVLGWQFADQFSSARKCGQKTGAAFEAGFATGAAMGLILLVCSASPIFKELVNASWSNTSPLFSSVDLSAALFYFMPASAEVRLHDVFAKASLPLFDMASLLVALFLVNSSLIAGLLSRVSIQPLRELFTWEGLPPLGKVLFGFVVACGALLVGSLANQDS